MWSAFSDEPLVRQIPYADSYQEKSSNWRNERLIYDCQKLWSRKKGKSTDTILQIQTKN
jgi:hypothetical protein